MILPQPLEIGPNLKEVLLQVIPVVNTVMLAWLAVRNRAEHASIRKEVRNGTARADRE